MVMMMAMMQHMQNVPQQAQRPPLPASAPESAKASVPMDEQKLAQVIFQQTAKGATYKSAIETMHGVSLTNYSTKCVVLIGLCQSDGYAAYSWKDFYLERKQRIDYQVDQLKETASRAQSQTKLVKKERSESLLSDVQSVSVFHSQKKPREKSKLDQVSSTKVKRVSSKSKIPSENEPSTSSRRTMNSLSVTPSNALLAQVPVGVPIDPHTDLPACPSERPTPPPMGQSKGHRGRGNAYTEEDTVFFFKLIAWELANNDNATKGSICELLGELVSGEKSISQMRPCLLMI